MDTGKKILIKRIIFTVISVLCVVFIFSRSLRPGNESGNESSKVLAFLNYITNSLGFGEIFSHTFVRKCAHFTEFAVLSVFLYLMYKSYTAKYKNSLAFTMISYTFVALCDEFIQYYIPGRACAFTDVLIDISGATTGLLIVCLIYALSKMVKSERSNNQ